MKVLIVASFNKHRFAPFIIEQVESVQLKGVECQYFGIVGTGITGYLKAFLKLQKLINQFKPDVIHAHYGLSGLLANLQCNIPVITTYHGSDINNKKVLPFSKMAIFFSAFNIFVSQRTLDIAKPRKSYMLLPCGINDANFKVVDKIEAKSKLNLELDRKYVLFAGAFSNEVKNPLLAQKAIALLDDVTLIELKGYTREEVNLLMNAVDASLMTSFTEGSPQFIKEAMACGCPIVSVDVGDVKDVIFNIDGCYIAERDEKDIANKLEQAFSFKGKTEGRKRIVKLGLTNEIVAEKLEQIYQDILIKSM